MQPDLIYDIGFHEGQDTEFYLKKGFRVVAVEANPDLCAQGRERFSGPISDGRLTLVQKALAREPGTITFYQIPSMSAWSTCDPVFAEGYRRRGAPSVAQEVEAVTMAHLLKQYGVPYFLKVDIEGLDMVAIDGLREAEGLPHRLSMEAERNSFPGLVREIQTLIELGYDRFKIVPQSKVPEQVAASPAKEGVWVDHQFPHGASGLFGEEAPGRWLTEEEVLAAYRHVYWRYALTGPDLIAPRWARSAAWRLGVRPDWHDTHARLAGA
jgi:FkbM family methyltransferase